MICGFAALASSQALAQQAAPATTGELVVTGSRIPTPNLTSVSPISVVSGQDFRLEGANDTIDALNQLPQVSVGNGLTNAPNPLSGSGGFTTVDLRDLGTVRTLVLEDGKRLMPGDPTLGGEAADLDTIPSILIDRVDLVTGGASAVYGSDAVAGVVNFIMKHNFQGVMIDAQYSGDWHDNGNKQMQGLETAFHVPPPSGTVFDGITWDASAAIGANSPDGKGNVTAYVSYRHQDPVFQHDRDFSACQLSQAGGTPACTGSSNSNFFKDDASGVTYSVTGADPANIFTTTRNQLTTPPARFNSNAFEYLSRGDERYNGGFFAHYQAAPWADAYSDFSFMDDRTVIHAAPSALFQQTFFVNCGNPLLSAQQVQTICTNDGLLLPTDEATLNIGRRDVEGGPRIYSFEHLSYKADIGVRGDLGDAWHYDTYAQYGRTQYNSSVQNDISLTKAQDALLVGGTAANPVCLSGNFGCQPYNIFGDGGVTPGSLAYILTSGTATGDTQEQIVHADITGELGKYGLKSPWATNGIGINVGAEYRREQLDQIPDETSLSGDLSGAGGALPPVHGAFDVKEFFGELRVPIVEDAPFAKELSFEGGYRFSHYSTSGNTNTYKLAADWAVNEDIRFRGSYQRAVRAPNVNELFTPQQITNSTQITTDPCAPTDLNGPATATLAQCENTAGKNISAAQIAALYGDGRSPQLGGTDKISQCPGDQCGIILGGLPSLTPEISKTYSVGVVLTPHMYIPGMNFSVDYYNIDISNAISTFPTNIAFNDCLDSATHCDLVLRQANGSLFGSNLLQDGAVLGTNVNIGHISTEGFDFSFNYRFGLDKLHMENKGQIAITFNGTWTEHLVFEPIPGAGTYDCAGLYGNTCGVPTPKWKHQLRISYITPWKFTLSGQWRFMTGGSLDDNSSNPLIGFENDTLDGHIGSYSYFDLSGTWKVTDSVELRAGINNIFDKDPPVLDDGVTGSGTPNTFNSYDLLGRVVFVGLHANF